MANDFAKVAASVYDASHERVLATGPPDWSMISTPIVEEIGTIVDGEVFGATTYDAKTTTGRPTAKTLDSAKTTTSQGQYEERLTFKRNEWEYDVPGIMEQVNGLIDLGFLSITQAFWTAWTTLSATTHPYNSETWLTAVGGGDCYYCDNLQIDPPNVAAFTQTNVYTTALSDAAVSTGIIAHQQYRGWGGNPWATRGRPYLVYNPALAHTAEVMLERVSEVAAGANGAAAVTLPPTGARLAGGLPIDGMTSYSAVDWYLVWVATTTKYRPDGSSFLVNSCPIQMWIRTLPDVVVEKVGNDMEVTAYAEWAVHLGPRSWDIQMNDV